MSLKIQLDFIKNGRHAAITDFKMRNIWKTIPGSYPITIE